MDARIAAAQHPLDAVCLRAERAGLLARQGDLDEARAELAVLHALHARDRHPLVSAWLHLADGLVLHFTNHSTAARDRMLRSLALGTAIRSRPVQALSAAWLAHMDFARFSFDSMVKHASIALGEAPETPHQALSRVSMVVAQTFHWAERMDLALPWYAKVRLHATAERDEFMLSAHIHNMAWMRCAQANRLSIKGQDSSVELLHARGGAESTRRYDDLVGTVSLVRYVPILSAQVLMLQKRYKEALNIFLENERAATDEGLDRLECCLLADRAWCRVQTGDLEGALKDARAAIENIVESTQVDDRAMARARVGYVLKVLRREEEASHQFMLADSDWHELSILQAHVVDMLEKMLTHA